jgi:hydrogenase-4 component F
MAALVLALGGLPPFGPFVSELSILRASLGGEHPGLGLLLVLLLALAFLAMASVLLPVLQGPTHRTGPRPREAPLTIVGPALVLAATLVLGIWVPAPVTAALGEAAQALGGGAP